MAGTDRVTYHLLDAGNAHRLETAVVFDNAVLPEQLARFVQDPGHLLVFAIMDEAVVGMASGNVLLHPDKQPVCFINEVGVEPHAQRKGVASRLCRMLMEVARAQGCKGIWLATETDNKAAQVLWVALA